VPAHSDTPALHFARRLAARADALAPPLTDADRVRAWPRDPVGFAREILGIQPNRAQRRILTAFLPHKRVATVSGHKVGKSTALAILALWFYCSFPAARVIVTATTDRQVNGIIWREIRRLVRGARVPIPGGRDIHVRANSGLDDPSDFSEIRGYTAKESEAIAGISGAYILYLVDEASGVAPAIFQAIEGNRAAGSAWVFLISNPTKADGEFYDAFHSKAIERMPAAGYFGIHVDSRESPNVTGEWRELEWWDRERGEWRPYDAPIPGLATPEWVAEKLEEWGEDSPLFKIRVAGEFCAAEDAKVFQAALIAEAEGRWETAIAAGRLYIGVDPAGDGDGGDQSGFAARRGAKVLELRARAGLSPAAHVAEVEDVIATAGARSDTLLPVVLVESEGEAGWKVYCALRDEAAAHGRFQVVRVRTSDRAVRQPLIYDRVRDEIWAAAREWVRAGGAIPESAQLAKDLHAPEFYSDIRGRQKITSKRDLRKLLGRSPDVGDAFVLSCWEPMSTRVDIETPPPRRDAEADDDAIGERLHNPFRSHEWMRGGRE